MKKLNVNKEACIGCGACVAIDSEHFDFGDDGLSEAISQENLDSENVANAISSCPTNPEFDSWQEKILIQVA